MSMGWLTVVPFRDDQDTPRLCCRTKLLMQLDFD